MSYKGNLAKGRQRWTKITEAKAFNERLQQIMEEDKVIKPINYDNVLKKSMNSRSNIVYFK